MNIIFGSEQAKELSNKYTVLELDTFQIGLQGPTVTAYCTVESIPIEELAQLESTVNQHLHLMINYRLKNWADCIKGIDALKGKWRGELDSFYQDLESRVKVLIENPPPADWSPIIIKD